MNDESRHRTALREGQPEHRSEHRPEHDDTAPRQMVALSPSEALDLLAGVPFGRIVFTEHALPAIRIVNHALVDGKIVIRTHKGAALTVALPTKDAPGAVVVYEADVIDIDTRSGWSVSVTGYARLLAPEDLAVDAELARYSAVPVPWFDAEMTHTVIIQPELVTGMHLLAPS